MKTHVGCSPPLLILSENYRYVLLKHERYCEHFLEIMLLTMYSLIFCVYTLTCINWYCPRSPPLAWSSTPVYTKPSCTRHLHLQHEGSGMVETTWSPSHAMEWRPRQRFKTAGDNIDGGFQHRPRPFPLEVNHCCSCRLHALVARALVSSEWVSCVYTLIILALNN